MKRKFMPPLLSKPTAPGPPPSDDAAPAALPSSAGSSCFDVTFRKCKGPAKDGTLRLHGSSAELVDLELRRVVTARLEASTAAALHAAHACRSNGAGTTMWGEEGAPVVQLEAYTIEGLDEYCAVTEAEMEARRRVAEQVRGSKGARKLEALVPLDANSLGGRLLQRLGWSAGQGLGREQQGRLEPVAAAVQQGRAGLGVNLHVRQLGRQRTAFRSVGFAAGED